MCLAIPVRIEELVDGETAVANIGGLRKRISVALIDEPQVGDYVLMHVGFALRKLDEDEARRTLALLDALAADDGADA